MTESTPLDDGVSRRNLFLGLGAAAGAGAVLAGLPGNVQAAGARAISAVPQHAPRPEVLGAPISGLTYVPFDALAFFTQGTVLRYSDDTSGTGTLTPPGYISVSLPLAVGSTIRQINVAYQGTPIVEIARRTLAAPPIPPVTQFAQHTLEAGGGPKSQTINLNGVNMFAPVVIEAGYTYALRFFLSAGDSVYGATLGYEPATQTFVPFTGTATRVLDTRVTGGKLQSTEERVVNLGFAGARSAVFNLAITETEGVGGFVAVFRADIPYPGNASINWSGPNVNLSNGVISGLDPNGAIKIRGGANATHVVIDRIGFFV